MGGGAYIHLETERQKNTLSTLERLQIYSPHGCFSNNSYLFMDMLRKDNRIN